VSVRPAFKPADFDLDLARERVMTIVRRIFKVRVMVKVKVRTRVNKDA